MLTVVATICSVAACAGLFTEDVQVVKHLAWSVVQADRDGTVTTSHRNLASAIEETATVTKAVAWDDEDCPDAEVCSKCRTASSGASLTTLSASFLMLLSLFSQCRRKHPDTDDVVEKGTAVVTHLLAAIALAQAVHTFSNECGEAPFASALHMGNGALLIALAAVLQVVVAVLHLLTKVPDRSDLSSSLMDCESAQCPYTVAPAVFEHSRVYPTVNAVMARPYAPRPVAAAPQNEQHQEEASVLAEFAEEARAVDAGPHVETISEYRFENGDVYAGEWRDGMMHGYGTYTWPDGHSYVGEFTHNTKHGQGVEFSPEGEMIRSGTFCNDEFIGVPPADAPLVRDMSDDDIREELERRQTRREEMSRLATMSEEEIEMELERRAGARMPTNPDLAALDLVPDDEEVDGEPTDVVPKFGGAKPVVTVAITGGAGQIAYSLIPHMLNGYVFGPNKRVVLKLLDIPPAAGVLEAVKMEVEDLAFPLMDDIIVTTDADEAFSDCDAVVFLGAFPRKAGMERKDLMEKNIGIFKAQGLALAKHAKPTCKCVVVGNPANTNCLTLMKYAPNLPKSNFTALTRLDANRLRQQVALKAGVKVKDVRGTYIWGNHSSTQFPDVSTATVNGKPALTVIDEGWYKSELVPAIQVRGAAVIKARGSSSAASAAKGAADHLRDWVLGTKDGPVSMAVSSDGNTYGVPEGLIYSFPVVCSGGKWKIVKNLPVSSYMRSMLDKTATELAEEKAVATEILEAPPAPAE